MNKNLLDELVVVKRSGQRVGFNKYKIAVVIKNAFDSVYDNYNEKDVNELFESVLKHIEKNYNDRKTINVEDIQDIIENKLLGSRYSFAYTSFSEYRKKRAQSRQVFTTKQEHKFAKAMEMLADDKMLVEENNYLPVDILKKYGNTVTQEFAKAYIIDNKYLRSHEEGNIFMHNMRSFPLGMVSDTCINLSKQIENNDINIITKNLIDLKSEIDGEINIPSIDNTFGVIIINKIKEYFQDYFIKYLKVSGFYNYINTKKILELINKESSLPFELEKYKMYILSLQVEMIFQTAYEDAFAKLKKELYKELKYLVLTLENNNEQNKKYSISFGSSNTVEGNIINETLIDLIKELKVLTNVGFIYKVKQENQEFLQEISELIINGKNILLSFVEKDNEQDTEYFSSGVKIYENKNDVLKTSIGRMVIATTSINLVRLALKHENTSKKQFYLELDEILESIKNELILTFETIGDKTKNNYKYLFNGNILSDEKLETGGKIRKVIKNGVLNIDLVGLKECLLVLAKDKNEVKLLEEILKHINEKCKEFREETKLNFYITEHYNSLASKEFMTLDKTIYGIRKQITDKCRYSLICTLPSLSNDYKLLGKMSKYFQGGNLILIKLKKDISCLKMINIIKQLKESEIGIVKFIPSSE